MDEYKYCTICVYIRELWDYKEVSLFENNNQGMWL